MKALKIKTLLSITIFLFFLLISGIHVSAQDKKSEKGEKLEKIMIMYLGSN